MNAGWYHNGGNTTDDPRVEFVKEDDYSHAGRMSDGPFETFADAKADLLHHYTTMADAFNIAYHDATKLKEPK